MVKIVNNNVSFGDYINIFAVFLVLVMLNSKINLHEYNWWIIGTSATLCTFLAIFLPLIVKKFFEKKRSSFLEQQWEPRSKEFKDKYNLIQENISDKKFNLVETNLSSLQDIIRDMTYIEQELNFEKFTGTGIKLFIGAIIFALLDIFTGGEKIITSLNLTWVQVTFTSFIFGLAYSFRIVQNWFELHKQTKTILDK